MKVRLECVTGGICFHKEADVNTLPKTGEAMTFPIGKGGQQMELVVQEVRENIVVLSAPIGPDERLDYGMTASDGWGRYPTSGVNFSALYENFSNE